MKLFYRVVFMSFLGSTTASLAQVDLTLGGPATPLNFAERYTLNSANPANLQWVPDPAGSGKTVLFARVRDSDSLTAGGKRTEISPLKEYIAEGVRWYAFSFYLPQSWEFHAYDTGVAQLHTSKQTAVLAPPVVFVIKNDKLVLSRHRPFGKDIYGNDLPLSKENSSTVDSVISTVNKGKWYCLVVRADWSSTPNTGSLQIWLNKYKVLNETEAKVLDETKQHNAYPTSLGNYPKAGLYMPGQMGVDKREIYLDFIHMGDHIGDVGTKYQENYAAMYALTPCAAR